MDTGPPAWNRRSFDEADVEYRRVCLPAVLAFLLGLASIGIFLGPLLLVLPLAGLGVGLLALAKIDSSAGHLSGQSLARWGIALALFFGVAETVRPVVYGHLIVKQGTAFATQWLEMLAAGDSEQAVTLIEQGARLRMAPVDPRGKSIPHESLEEDILRQFQQDPLVDQMRVADNSIAGTGAEIRMVELASPPRTVARKTTIGLVMLVRGGADRRHVAAGDAPPNGRSNADGTGYYVYLELQKSRSTSTRFASWSVALWKSAATLAKLAENH